jgi:Protein of unknown function (DUF1579)
MIEQTAKLAEIQNELIGNWTGTNLLRLNWLTPPNHLSPTSLTVAPVAKGKFLSFTYDWSHENVAQEGLLVLGHDREDGVVTAAWIDSWHMTSKILTCMGSIDRHGAIDVRGSYAAPPGPDWGWRIVISVQSGGQLQITMYNCSPEGVEELAVQANYERKS